MRTIISTGLGRLHLVQSAIALNDIGVDVRLIQGWVPQHIPDPLLKWAGRWVGSTNLAASMAKRRPIELPSAALHTCPWPDFKAQALFAMTRKGLLDHSRAAASSWISFGKCSRQYLHNADIFHVRSGAGRGGAIATAKKNGLKIICDHTIAHPAFIEQALKKEFIAHGLKFWGGASDKFWCLVLEDCREADILLVNSEFVKKTFLDEGFDAEQIKVVTQGVRDDFFSVKQNYQSGKRLELLFTGMFGIRKGAPYLIDAIKTMRRSGADVHLTVVGSGDEGMRLARQAGIDNNITYVGPVTQERLAAYLAMADIYIFPSLAEGCASAGLEAMGAGLPVVATYESGLPIFHGENGLMVRAKSSDDLVEACMQLRSDEQLRAKLGRKATETIMKGYTWVGYAEKVRKIYETALTLK